MRKPTQKELVARYLVGRGIGTWVPGHELVKSASPHGNIIQDADTRAYDLVREGFESDKWRYTFESKRIGKFTYFRAEGRKPRESVDSLLQRQAQWAGEFNS